MENRRTHLNQFVKPDYRYREKSISFEVKPAADEQGFVHAYHVDVVEPDSYFNTVYRGIGDMPRSVDGLYAGLTDLGEREVSCMIVLELESDPPRGRETFAIRVLCQGAAYPPDLWVGIEQVLASIDHFCANKQTDLPDDGAKLHEAARTHPHDDIGHYPVRANHKIVGLLVTGDFPDRQGLLGIYRVAYRDAQNRAIQRDCPVILFEDRSPHFSYASFRDLLFELADYAPSILE